MGQLVLLLLAFIGFLVVLYLGSIGYREQLLFSADGNCRSDLDKEQLTQGVRELFHTGGHLLSKSAYVECVEEGSEWIIRDPISQKEYLALLGENGINISRRILIMCLGNIVYDKLLLEVICQKGWIEALDERKLPQDLSLAFAEHGHFLSPAATVEIRKQGAVWTVEDSGKEYHLAGDERLRVSCPALRDLADDKNYVWQWDSVTAQLSRRVLFSVNIRYFRDWPEELCRRQIPEGLRASFFSHRYPLSPDTTVIGKKENEWLIQEDLFATPEEVESDLRRGIISPQLRQMFENTCHPLSQNAAAACDEHGEPLIRDQGEVYFLRRREDAIHVYSRGYAVVKDENSLNVCRDQESFGVRRLGWYSAAPDNTDVYPGESDIRPFRNFAAKFWEKARISASVVLPALFATVLLAAVLGILHYLCRWEQRQTALGRAGVYVLRTIERVIDSLPSIFAAIPVFVTGVLIIKLTHTDLIDSYNFAYGTLCLAAFNVSYFYRRSQHQLREAYHAPDVLFARSLGINERTIFRRYVFPRVIHGNLVIVRELLPHVVVESIVIEYVFVYGGLLRSALDVLVNYRAGDRHAPTPIATLGDWQSLAYIAMVLYFSVLFIAFFAYICRCLEDYFSPQ